jgi:hypothetical protein
VAGRSGLIAAADPTDCSGPTARSLRSIRAWGTVSRPSPRAGSRFRAQAIRGCSSGHVRSVFQALDASGRLATADFDPERKFNSPPFRATSGPQNRRSPAWELKEGSFRATTELLWPSLFAKCRRGLPRANETGRRGGHLVPKGGHSATRHATSIRVPVRNLAHVSGYPSSRCAGRPRPATCTFPPVLAWSITACRRCPDQPCSAVYLMEKKS